MSWQKIYAENHQDSSKNGIEVGIRDWKQMSNIFLKWLESQSTDKNSKILDCGCGIGIGGSRAGASSLSKDSSMKTGFRYLI